jgi:hypothetical protein
MNTGDKIVCVNHDSDSPIIVENLKASFTIGKTYEIRFVISTNAIMVLDNLGKTRAADLKHFIPLRDWREKQIDKII